MAKFNLHNTYDALRCGVHIDNKPINVNGSLVKEVTRDYDGSMTVTLEGNPFDFLDECSCLFKGHSKNELYKSNKEEIKRVIFNEPYTIVIWANEEKTIVKAQDGEPYDKEKGLAMCFAKYALGNTGRYFDFFKEVCNEVEEKAETKESSK